MRPVSLVIPDPVNTNHHTGLRYNYAQNYTSALPQTCSFYSLGTLFFSFVSYFVVLFCFPSKSFWGRLKIILTVVIIRYDWSLPICKVITMQWVLIENIQPEHAAVMFHKQCLMGRAMFFNWSMKSDAVVQIPTSSFSRNITPDIVSHTDQIRILIALISESCGHNWMSNTC